MSKQHKATLCVMISGRGSNLKALIDASEQPDFPAKIKLVITDNPSAGGLEFANTANIATKVFDRAEFVSKSEHEVAILEALADLDPDLICLAGYMRILSADFVSRFPNRIVNIHPSLLPKYPGLDTHQRVLDAGDDKHGCTVHYVDKGMDTGPVILQESIQILENDDPASLATRLLEVEHRIYPKAIKMVLNQSP